jgi:hypothetical protein
MNTPTLTVYVLRSFLGEGRAAKQRVTLSPQTEPIEDARARQVMIKIVEAVARGTPKEKRQELH